jgi:hypothetical protein
MNKISITALLRDTLVVGFSIIAFLTPLPSALAANFFSSVEANSSAGWELKLKAFWEDDKEAREGAKPSSYEATLNGSDFLDVGGGTVELLDFKAAFEENQFRLQDVVLKLEYRNLGREIRWNGSEAFPGLYFRRWPINDNRGLIIAKHNVLFDSNIQQQQSVTEPNLTLGFITLGSLMLGSRKKKEAKKT